MILYFVMTTKNEEEDIECYIIINRNRHNITYVYMFLFSIIKKNNYNNNYIMH